MLLGRGSPLLNKEGLSIDWTGLNFLLTECYLDAFVGFY
jgi:hypothetical protein